MIPSQLPPLVVDDLSALDMRLNRLEMLFLGVELSSSSSPGKTNHTPHEDKPSSSRESFQAPTPSSLRQLNHNHENPTSDNNNSSSSSSLAILDSTSSLVNFVNNNNNTSALDFSSRLSALEFQFNNNNHSLKNALTEWSEMDQSFQELDPGVALTHSQQIVAPLIYRRQEILASADVLIQNFKYASEILNLLSIGQSTSSTNNNNNNNTEITEMHVTKAPILTSTTSSTTTTTTTKWAELESDFFKLGQQIQSLSHQMDHILIHYQQLVRTISEKLVFVEEDIRNRQKKTP